MLSPSILQKEFQMTELQLRHENIDWAPEADTFFFLLPDLDFQKPHLQRLITSTVIYATAH